MGRSFPDHKVTASTAVKKIIDGLIPRYALPSVIGLDKGPTFVLGKTELVKAWRLIGNCIVLITPKVQDK